jgi:hypothetical protein
MWDENPVLEVGSRPPPLGRNLVRLVYLDEAGISRGESAMCVAGVIIHGDQQSTEVQRKLDEIIQKHIPASDRLGFVFHATDIFHGSRYFDRPKWPRDDRIAILRDLAALIEEFHLPIVVGAYVKETFGGGAVPPDLADDKKIALMQSMAVMDCAVQADRWLARYAGDENAMLIAEDADRVKKQIKRLIMTLKHPERMKEAGLEEAAKDFDLPLKRIIDTVHFAAKEDCAPLQLADLCAFCVARISKGKEVPDAVLDPIIRHAGWIRDRRPSAISSEAKPG